MPSDYFIVAVTNVDFGVTAHRITGVVTLITNLNCSNSLLVGVRKRDRVSMERYVTVSRDSEETVILQPMLTAD